MTNIKMGISGTVIYLLISGCVLPALALDSFTQADRERLVRMETTQTVFMQQMDKRLEQVDKRFEQVDKRFEELRTDMNARFEQTTNMFYVLSVIFTTLFAAVFSFAWWDRRLRTDMNARFEQTTNMFYVLSVIFTTLFAAVFSFAWWDRRSVLITARKAAKEVVEEKSQDIEKIRLTVEQVVEVLRRHADKTPAFRDIMQRAHLL